MLLACWLFTWIVLSWAGIQDDALIHLRYANNLFQTHFITYDGVHPSYGASSLLYVYLLSLLRTFSASTNLPRTVSSVFHLLLFAGTALLVLRLPRESALARILGLTLLVFLVAPSSVRWLDDGMETSLALCFAALLCWVTFRQLTRVTTSLPEYFALTVLGCFAVLLRIELLLPCGLSFAILGWKRLVGSGARQLSPRIRAALSGSPLLLGGLVALIIIRVKMHHLLPDTALAKSDGIPAWGVSLYVTSKILAGALSFGVGIFLFWTLTLFLLWRTRKSSTVDVLANLAFPIVFSLAALRGQQIQGARYFVWAFLFSILWNILRIGELSSGNATADPPRGLPLAYGFLALLVLAMPIESWAMYPMLKERATLLDRFESDHFDSFRGKRGVAYDVGLIGYFTQADICDLAGLVNGREKAKLNLHQRIAACVASPPDFMFLDPASIDDVSPYLSLNDWQVCSHYDFRNVHATDPHFLLVPRATAAQICREVAGSVPSEVEHLAH
jgi:hypothetical protein